MALFVTERPAVRGGAHLTAMTQPDLPAHLSVDVAVTRARQLREMRRFTEAENLLRSALIPTRSGRAALWLELGTGQAAHERHAEAADSFQQALKLDPKLVAAHVARAQSLRSLGRGDDATAHFDAAARLEPQVAQHRLLALLHRGTMLEAAGRTTEAMAVFEQATEQFPDSADAWSVLGVVEAHLRSPEEAQSSLAKALSIDPNRIEVMERFARTQLDLKQYEEAGIVFEEMFRKEPTRPLLASWLLHVKYLMGDWLNLERLQARIQTQLQAGELAAEPFGLQGWCADPALLRSAAVAQTARAHPYRPQYLSPPVIGRGPKIRLGYLAGEFREQATSVLLTEVLERHDRGQFEVFAFDTGWDDASPRRRRIEAACQMRSIRGMSDLNAARMVRDHGIDILLNLNGFFGLARTGVFSMRPAAIQVNYLGFPGTVGAPYIDYIVADRTVIPEAERPHYVEKVVYLPDSYQPNDSTRAISEWPRTRSEAGLPDDAFVFCCLNNAYKIVPAVFDVWMRLLQRVPGSVLLLFGDKPYQQANLRHEAQQRGVAADRILFASHWRNEEHLRRLQLCDLFLDTWPYNAHTTGSDALWAGLPVLTLTGRSFPSRVGASLLQSAGLPELITNSLTEYEALATRLALEPDLLVSIRGRLKPRNHSAVLYDTATYTRHLESAFTTMVERARRGEPADSFDVQPQRL